MKFKIVKLFLIFIILPNIVLGVNQKNVKKIDKRLIGSWQGERSNIPNCQYFSWSIERNLKGKYKITFFSDKNRINIIAVESGTWWVNNGMYYSISSEIMKKPDVYSYEVNKNNVFYKVLGADKSSDCKEDYEFFDYKVK